MEQRSSGGNYPAITPSELKRIEIPLPEIATQTKIVAEVRKRKSSALSMRAEANAELERAKHEIEAILLKEAP
jgi:restriction endonuclease S subunit